MSGVAQAISCSHIKRLCVCVCMCVCVKRPTNSYVLMKTGSLLISHPTDLKSQGSNPTPMIDEASGLSTTTAALIAQSVKPKVYSWARNYNAFFQGKEDFS